MLSIESWSPNIPSKEVNIVNIPYIFKCQQPLSCVLVQYIDSQYHPCTNIIRMYSFVIEFSDSYSTVKYQWYFCKIQIICYKWIASINSIYMYAFIFR